MSEYYNYSSSDDSELEGSDSEGENTGNWYRGGGLYEEKNAVTETESATETMEDIKEEDEEVDELLPHRYLDEAGRVQTTDDRELNFEHQMKALEGPEGSKTSDPFKTPYDVSQLNAWKASHPAVTGYGKAHGKRNWEMKDMMDKMEKGELLEMEKVKKPESKLAIRELFKKDKEIMETSINRRQRYQLLTDDEYTSQPKLVRTPSTSSAESDDVLFDKSAIPLIRRKPVPGTSKSVPKPPAKKIKTTSAPSQQPKASDFAKIGMLGFGHQANQQLSDILQYMIKEKFWLKNRHLYRKYSPTSYDITWRGGRKSATKEEIANFHSMTNQGRDKYFGFKSLSDKQLLDHNNAKYERLRQVPRAGGHARRYKGSTTATPYHSIPGKCVLINCV